MVGWVLDTSVVVKWFLQEEDTEKAEVYLRSLVTRHAEIAVPSSMFYEIANVFWVRRRDGLTKTGALALWAELVRLPLEIVSWTETQPESISFAYDYDISPYDAVFVVLARELGRDFITADKPLHQKVHATCPWVKLL